MIFALTHFSLEVPKCKVFNVVTMNGQCQLPRSRFHVSQLSPLEKDPSSLLLHSLCPLESSHKTERLLATEKG